jgi:hypothetical protein
MFCQPGAPSYSTFTVKDKTITVNSYTADEDGNATLFNTFKVVREKEHTPLEVGWEEVVVDELPTSGTSKVLHNGRILLVRDGVVYDLLGAIVQ